MSDCHFDLLTFAYVYSKNEKLNYFKKYCESVINPVNINSGILNFYFLNKKKMKSDLNIDMNENSPINLVKCSIDILRKNTNINLNQFILGIEGFEYFNISNLDLLYKIGIRAITITWNFNNKYASGVLGDNQKLTTKGKKLIKKLIDLNMIIDLSHIGENSFFDIIDICHKERKKGKNPIVIASHSNSYTLTKNKRNLTDMQLKVLKSINGYVGVVTYADFCTITSNLKKDFITHLEYINNIMGSKNIFISSDDLSLDPSVTLNKSVFKHSKFIEIKDLLKEKFNSEDINNIILNNFNYIKKVVK
ncbi:MAG: membrane dipeptidase [Bacilli bacterium]